MFRNLLTSLQKARTAKQTRFQHVSNTSFVSACHRPQTLDTPTAHDDLVGGPLVDEVPTVIYAEIPEANAWLTGLGVVLGVGQFGLAGVVLGPLLASVPLICRLATCIRSVLDYAESVVGMLLFMCLYVFLLLTMFALLSFFWHGMT